MHLPNTSFEALARILAWPDAEASLIVSGQRDLLTLGMFRDIRILTSADALTLIGR